MSFIDMTGRRCGRWLVKSRAPQTGRDARWHCVCDCGNEASVNGATLRNGTSQSCGCLLSEVMKARAIHGKHNTRVYRVWDSMLARCSNPNHAAFLRYGARGIKVCKRWHKFENFYADMGDPPAGLTLERKNNDGDYKPSNCYWATYTEQARNKSSNVTGMYEGRRWCAAALAEVHGIDRGTASWRIRHGWDFVAACTTPAWGKK